MINRLASLYELQLIDDELDQLEELRGDLPLAVNDLNQQIDDLKDQTKSKEEAKEEAQAKRIQNEEEVEKFKEDLTKYKAHLYSVRNNKEYDALTKEIDRTEELIKKLEEETAELETYAEKMKGEIEELQPGLESLNEALKTKESDLKTIIKANEREESKLREKREQVMGKIKKPDYNTYARIRKAKGGKAIATLNRSACTGCHNVVPPQRQIEIRQNKRFYTCESCGRLLVSPDIAEEVESNFKI